MQRLLPHLAVSCALVALLAIPAVPSFAQSPTVTTDKGDYVPGETVIISGQGWLPGETVTMILFEDREVLDVRMVSATANDGGAFTNTQFSPQPTDLGVTFTLVATGQTSGWTAQTTFTDGPKVGSVDVGTVSPSQLCPGSTSTSTITVNRNTGPGSSGSFTATLSITPPLPAGVTASFSPTSLSFTPSQDSRTSTLTLTASSSASKGPTSFTVRAANGANDFAESGGSLTVDTEPPFVSAPATQTANVGAGCQATVPDLRSTIAASDNCTSPGSLVVAQSPAPGALVGLGTTVVTFTVQDALGNSASATTSLVVSDHTAPVVTLLGANPMTVEGGTPYVEPGVTAVDGCTGNLPVSVSGSVNVNQPGVYQLTYSANDGHGNSASASRTVNVVDTTPPVLTLVGTTPMTVECHSTFGDPGATAHDQCAGDVSGAIQVTGSVNCNSVGSYTLTYSVNDGHGNVATTTRTVNVVDTTPPSLTLAGATPMTMECHSLFSDPGASASDLCAGDVSSAVQVSGSVNHNEVGTYTLTYSVNDGHGNVASETRTVNVVDTSPPSLTLAGITPMTVECHSLFSDPGASATDLCAGDVSGAVQVSGSVNHNEVGTYTLTYSVNDGHGNVASETRTVNVVDTTPPSLTLSGATPMTIECHAAFSDPGASATDLCAGDLSNAVQVSGSVNHNEVGSYTLTYSVNDGHGNVASTTRTVNVVDTTPPSLTLTGATPMTVECHSLFSDPGASATDLCAGDVSGAVQVSGSVNANAVGTYTLSYSVNDGHGNVASETRSVNVVDTTPPSLTLAGATPMTIECHSAFTDPGASATDLCAGDLSSAIQVAGTVDASAIGTYTLTYSVADGHGNVGTAVRSVRVADTAPPVLSMPDAVKISTGSSATVCGAVVTDAALGAASAADVCAGSLTVQRIDVPQGNLFPVGETKVQYSATDPSGNVVTGVQVVTVVDDTPPAVQCPADLTTPVDAGSCAAVVRYTPSITDNCPGATLVATPPSGSSFAVGTTTYVKVVATDAAGNSTSSGFKVTVTNPAPVVTISGPPSGAVFAVGATVSFTGSFTDNAGDTHTAKWLLDGQAFPGVVNEATGAVTLARAFTVPGVYAVTLSVTDQCGGEGVASDVGGMTAMVVIYDPAGGFVTGGGWIDSPAGAYRPDVTLTGKANFGFVSKYKKGATAPTGDTEFQFKAGNLNFHSSSYDWLVVSGFRAQFKGVGTVNGAGDYGFLLSAVDGDLSGGGKADKFRMKVWDRASGTIVYDNQYGSADSSVATTVLGGGSIMVTTSSPGANKASLAMAPALDGESARVFALAPAFPNPFRNATSLRFSVPEASRVTLAIYDASGREVARPWEGDTAPGSHMVPWPSGTSHELHSGVYFVRLTATSSSGAGFTQKQTIVLVR